MNFRKPISLIREPAIVTLAGAVYLCSAPLARCEEWTPTASPASNWTCIACSADGQTVLAGSGDILVRGLLHTSTNFGAGWATQGSPYYDWTGVTMAADASAFFAAALIDKCVETTTNGGTWVGTSAPAGMNWEAIACSGDGGTILAGAWGACFSSHDRGTTWSPVLTNADLRGIGLRGAACSADGMTQVVAPCGTSQQPDVPPYWSTDSGQTWLSLAAELRAAGWSGAACSADGRTVLICAPDLGVCITTNKARSWWSTNIAMAYSVACSADGTALVAGDWNGGLHTSTNSGVSWSSTYPGAGEWMGVASSADGCKMAAAAWNGKIWVLERTPSPVLSFQFHGANLLLSWIVPSMPFQLQQCSDLNSLAWTNVMTAPVLNYSNLHYEVTVSATLDRRFFRLISR
jgi:hypothetical protein